uniref:Protein Wnt n=1 Tax=Halisarca dujardinii TaxID=2583056 RepID=A0A175BZM1_HALDU
MTPTARDADTFLLMSRSLALQSGLVQPNGHLAPANCSEYLIKGVIQPHQYEVCMNNSYLVSAITKGLRRAIASCQSTFKNNIWNCTAYKGAYLLGRAIETKESKESAYARTLISAAITYDIATACRENIIPNCPCAHDFPFVTFEGDIVKFGGCSDNYGYAIEVNKAFTGGEEEAHKNVELSAFINSHNNELGRKVVSESYTDCRCHGQTGSCNIRICYKRLKPFTGADALTYDKYRGAVRVTLANHPSPMAGQVVVQGGSLQRDDMIYSDQSPSYCESNQEMNILGTHGRQCDTSHAGLGSCDVLCCGRGYWRTTKSIPIRKCETMFDSTTGRFEVLCSVTGNDIENRYFCN